MALTQRQVVEVSMRLLQRDGLKGVSFRKIAAELNVSAPTLYWHVDSKRRLLDLMADELMSLVAELVPIAPEPGEPWWRWLERRTRAMYQTLICHRDAPLVVAGNRPTVAALPAIEAYLETMIAAGFEPGEAFETILSIGAFTVGCALEWQAEAARGVADEPDGELAMAVRSDYPSLLKAFTQHRERHETVTPHDQMFEQGLALIISGLRSRLHDASATRR